MTTLASLAGVREGAAAECRDVRTQQRTRRLIKRTLLIYVVISAAVSADGYAQDCQVPGSVRSLIPAEAPREAQTGTRSVTGLEGAFVPLGVGHLHYSDQNPIVDLPPGADDWLQRVRLPLSVAPGAAPTAWIADGWIVSGLASPEPLLRSGLIETGYEEPSFVVLESRPDGWLRLR